jgi:hypothetical protein
MNPKRVQTLLDELCIGLGFCLPPQVCAQLKEKPPTNVAAFSEAIFRAEGLDSGASRRLSRQVRDVVSKHFCAWEEEESKEPNQPLQRNASTGSVSNLKSPARRG